MRLLSFERSCWGKRAVRGGVLAVEWEDGSCAPNAGGLYPLFSST